MKDRITQFLISENISSAEFADKIGVQRSSVSHVLNERNYPSTSFIQKILTTYGNLNPRWLLLGEGPMFSSPSAISKEPSLFSTTQNEDFSTPKNTVSKEEMVENSSIPNSNVTPEKNPELISSPFQSPIDLKAEVKDIIGITPDNKDVERIVLFYTDKTFTVYTPSK